MKNKKSTISSDHSTYTFSAERGLILDELQNNFTGDNNVKTPEQTLLFVVTSKEGRISAADFRVARIERTVTEEQEELLFILEHPDWEAELSIAVDRTEESRWCLVLTNRGSSAARVKVSFPVLGGLVIGDDISTNRIHHGLNGGMFYDGPIRLRGCSGYSFPVMDVYDISEPSRSGGVYMRIEDLSGELKTFEIVKRQRSKETLDVDEAYWSEAYADVFDFEEGVGMAVHYQEFEAQPGEPLRLPPAAIGVHPYRWERCWENYRRWVNSWYEVKRARPKWWREVFVHKALHQQHFRRNDEYIAPEDKQEYEWDWRFSSGGDYVPVEELVKTYDDMYNWNHWMASRGDYDVRADWGGSEPFARYLHEIQRAGVRNALYMEAISVERGSNVGRACGERWAVLKDGVRLTSGPPHSEYAFCPGVPGWRKHIAHEVAKVLRETRCDAIYIDSVALNYWLCEDTSHPHPYRRGYHRSVVQLLEEVNEAIDRVAPDTVLYLEFWSTDVATQYISGCFSPVVTAGLGFEDKGKPVAPTGTNLFRFYFPDFKIIEIMPENSTGVELSFFNGNAIHGYLNTEATTPTIEKLAPIWRANLDCFTSDDVEALLETGVSGVYMNRFGATGKQLYTVWNASNEDLSEVSLPVVVPEGWRATDLLKEKALKVRSGSGETRVVINLPGRSLSVFTVSYK